MELKELLKVEKKDVAAIKNKMEECNSLAQKMSTELYQKAAKQEPHAETEAREEQEPKKSKGKTVEEEYEVKEEKKK